MRLGDLKEHFAALRLLFGKGGDLTIGQAQTHWRSRD